MKKIKNYIKNMRSLTKFVIFSFAIILIYSTIELITPTSHDTLTTCVYACFGGEVLACALIKIFKLKETDPNACKTTMMEDLLSEEEIHALLNADKEDDFG